MDFVTWAIHRHEITNHMYEDYLPYEYHLRLALQVAKEFQHLVPKAEFWRYRYAIAGHDLYEDARTNYSDVIQHISLLEGHTNEDAIWVAEVILAVTEYPGRNRNERHPPIYWQNIRETPGAKFVKLCDKIANVRHGVMFKNSKLSMHMREHNQFLSEMQLGNEYREMQDHLDQLLFGQAKTVS